VKIDLQRLNEIEERLKKATPSNGPFLTKATEDIAWLLERVRDMTSCCETIFNWCAHSQESSLKNHTIRSAQIEIALLASRALKGPRKKKDEDEARKEIESLCSFGSVESIDERPAGR
jgi:hypothetical protein